MTVYVYVHVRIVNVVSIKISFVVATARIVVNKLRLLPAACPAVCCGSGSVRSSSRVGCRRCYVVES